MLLLDLPGEILLAIGEAAVANRETSIVFQHLYLCCKTIQNLYQPLLPRYNLVRKYRDFGYGRNIKSVRGWPIRTPWQLLYEIHLKPEIANVIEIADLRMPSIGVFMTDRDFPWHVNENSGYEDFDMENAISSILEHSPYLSQTGCRWSHWLERMLEQEQRWRFHHRAAEREVVWGNVFLLSLLPNIESIVVDGYFATVKNPKDRPLIELLKHLVKNAHHESAPLSKLREVLPTAESGFDQRYAMDSYQYFLALPTIEAATLGCCVAMDDGNTGLPLTFEVDVFPMLKELDLWNSVMGVDEVYELLSRMPSLEVFKLNEDVKRHGCGYESFDPKGVVSSVVRAAGHHLRSFSLTTACDLGGCVTSITSFQGFEKLEDLEFSCDLIDEASFHLMGTIPNSVKRLRLKGEFAFADGNARRLIKKLFEGFNAGLLLTLPNLEIVEVLPPNLRLSRIPEEVLDDFQHLVEPYDKVQALPEDGFKLMQHTKPWPEWFRSVSNWYASRGY